MWERELDRKIRELYEESGDENVAMNESKE